MVVIAVDGNDGGGHTLTIDQTVECGDGLDNDGDGRIDHPWDPGCESPADADEDDPSPPPACADGVDNDGDGRTDFPADPSCLAASWPNETTEGESCTSPVDITLVEPGRALSLSRAVLDHTPQASCLVDFAGTASADQVFRLSLSGQAQISATAVGGLVAITTGATGCADTAEAMDCGHDQAQAVAGPGDVYIIVWGSASSLIVSGTLQDFTACDPARVDDFPCDGLAECREVDGTFQCDPPQCRNGRDDDDDGLVDFGEDPGCSFSDDNDETDPCDERIAAPAMAPAGGAYVNSVLVTIAIGREVGAGVVFTLDGRDPARYGTAYTEAPTLTSSATVRAKATRAGGTVSCAEASAVFVVTDQLAPSVVATDPAVGAVRLVGTVAQVSVTFSEAVNGATVGDATIQCFEAGPDAVTGTPDDVYLVDSGVTYDDAARTAHWHAGGPDLTLAAGRYRCVATDGIRDLAGNTLTTYAWTFQVTIDSDGDGVPDSVEVTMGLNPLDADSDLDGIPDGDEDADGDGLSNRAEVVMGSNPLVADTNGNGVNDGAEDADGDGLKDGQEAVSGTNPFLPDSDGDGWFDGVEVEVGSLPLNPASRPVVYVVSAPPVSVWRTTADGSTGAGVGTVVAYPPVVMLRPAPSTDGLGASVVVGTPPVAVYRLDPAALGSGFVVSYPPTSVMRPGWGDETPDDVKFNTVVAQPPVTVGRQ